MTSNVATDVRLRFRVSGAGGQGGGSGGDRGERSSGRGHEDRASDDAPPPSPPPLWTVVIAQPKGDCPAVGLTQSWPGGRRGCRRRFE